MAINSTTRRILTTGLVATAFAAGAVVPAVAAPAPFASAAAHHTAGYGDSARLGYEKSVAVHVLKGVFERGDTSVVDRFVRTDYIQHNPLAPNGSQTLKNLAPGFHQQFPDAEYDVKRVMAEGDLVLVHSNVIATPGTRGNAVIDIFRFQGGKIAEHWDVGQEVPATTANGNDMFSTASFPRTEQPGPRWLTAYNEKLVTDYVERVGVKKDVSAVDAYVIAKGYQQHSPQFPNGSQDLKATLTASYQQFPDATYDIKRVIAEGDLVAVHGHYIAAPGQRGQAILDLFRVRDGKIVEHWDVIQDVPATSANDNTMF
ncbi:nuclear transport factor 2 family protein [Streptomyces prunicolor]|uniref:nuclear transport factor 2 family protein n=1 Tax=Streptomyces prunicolor TaxID=67348 RepID=UPI0037D3600B